MIDPNRAALLDSIRARQARPRVAPTAPGGVVTQNGQQGIMGRGNNFQPLGAAAQRRLAAGGTPGQLQGGPPGAPAAEKPMGPGRPTPPGQPMQGPGPGPYVAQMKPLVGPQGLLGQVTGGPLQVPGGRNPYLDLVRMASEGGLPFGPGGGDPAAVIDPAQGPAPGVPGIGVSGAGIAGVLGPGVTDSPPMLNGGIVNPGEVASRDMQPPMTLPGLRGGMQAGRGGYLPDARAGYANLMSRFAY